MQGSCLRFYLGEKQSHHGVLLWEWLLERANRLGLRGGCAFRAIGGFGRHHAVHEERFFELAGSSGVAVEFVARDDEIEQLLALIARERVRIFYLRLPAQFDVINPDADDRQAGPAEP
jgi:PII-like signaling protein